MAFATEFVAAAKTRPEVEYRTISVPPRTSSTSAYTVQATETVGSGSWLVVYEAPISRTGAGYYWDVRIGDTFSRVETTSQDQLVTGTVLRWSAVISGPTTCTVEARYGRLLTGTLHIARIG